MKSLIQIKKRMCSGNFTRGFGLLLLATLLLGTGARSHSSIVRSPEVAFTDAAPSGLAIVPASCPSSPHYWGECDKIANCQYQNTSDRYISGGLVCYCPTGWSGTYPNCIEPQLCPNGQVCVPCTTESGGACLTCPLGTTLEGGLCVYTGCPAGDMWSGGQCVCNPNYPLCSGNDIVSACAPHRPLVVEGTSSCNLPASAGCQNSGSGASCLPPPPAQVLSWIVKPTLITKGKSASVSWSVQNARTCTITGSNGDTWTLDSSAHPDQPITATESAAPAPGHGPEQSAC